jgi:hypothetical protein
VEARSGGLLSLAHRRSNEAAGRTSAFVALRKRRLGRALAARLPKHGVIEPLRLEIVSWPKAPDLRKERLMNAPTSAAAARKPLAVKPACQVRRCRFAWLVRTRIDCPIWPKAVCTFVRPTDPDQTRTLLPSVFPPRCSGLSLVEYHMYHTADPPYTDDAIGNRRLFR